MRARLTLIAALATTSLIGLPGHAASGPQVTDPASDANYLNDNAPVVLPAENPANNNPTPVGSTAAADILSIEWKTLKKKGTVTGFSVIMTLNAPPTRAGTLYRATSETDACTTLWFQYYTTKPNLTPQSSLRHTCDGDPVVIAIPTTVKDKTITWTFLFSDKTMPKAVKKGVDIIGMGGHSRDFVNNPSCLPNYLSPGSTSPDPTKCTTNPTQIDVTNNVAGPYKVGS